MAQGSRRAPTSTSQRTVRARSRRNTLFIGGDFTQRSAPPPDPTSPSTRSAPGPAGVPRVAGTVEAAAPTRRRLVPRRLVTAVAGVPRANLAHVLATRPSTVGTRARRPGAGPRRRRRTVYVGGDFTHVGGAARSRIAALSATTGQPRPEPRRQRDGARPGSRRRGPIRGRTVHQHRRALAQLHRRAELRHRPGHRLDPSAWQPVLALAVAGGTVYAGGEFTHVGGAARSRIAALDAVTVTPPAGPGRRRDGRRSARRRATVYASGRSAPSAGSPAAGWSASRRPTGRPPPGIRRPRGPWPRWRGTAPAFTSAASSRRSAASRAGTSPPSTRHRPSDGVEPERNGAVTRWPRAAASSSRGEFTSVGAQTRNHLAALDSPPARSRPGTRTPTAASPRWPRAAARSTSALVLLPGRRPAQRHRRRPRGHRAGAPLEPTASSAVAALAVNGTTVYAAEFHLHGHRPAPVRGGHDSATGRPRLESRRDARHRLASGPAWWYACGDFFTIGAAARDGLAALDAVTGQPRVGTRRPMRPSPA